MVSGSREVESFWLFASIMSKRKELGEPNMIGLSGMFTEHFPMLFMYVKVFHELFEEYLPELSDHLSDLPDALWINKWI